MFLFLVGFAFADFDLERQERAARCIPPRISKASWMTSFHLIALFWGLYIAGWKQCHSPLGRTNWWTWWLCLSACLTFWAILNLHPLKRLMTRPLSRYLGKISFGVYICHVPVLGICLRTTRPWFSSLLNEIYPCVNFWVNLILETALVILMADLFARSIDRCAIRMAKHLENFFITSWCHHSIWGTSRRGWVTHRQSRSEISLVH